MKICAEKHQCCKPQPIRILAIEGHPVFCEGLKTIIETQSDMVLIGQAKNVAEGIAQFRRHRPDITLLDIGRPGTNDPNALTLIREEFPRACIIVLTNSDSGSEIKRAL